MLKFTKMHGLGNDFVCINYDEVKQYNMKIFSKFICDRHFGIGADGVILYTYSKIADFKMRIFNCDGTEAEMCGNGIRCLAKVLYEKGLTNKPKIRIETLAGIKEIEYIMENEKILKVKVNLGKPQMDINRLPVYVPRYYRYKDRKCKLMFKIGDKELIGTFLTIGNPHTVIEVKDLESCLVTKYGRIVENYKYFPQKTNVEFVQIINNEQIKIEVWERGVGETLSSGTGASAAVYALFKEGKICEKVKVECKGGEVNIQIDKQTEEVWIEGAAIGIFEGEIDL